MKKLYPCDILDFDQTIELEGDRDKEMCMLDRKLLKRYFSSNPNNYCTYIKDETPPEYISVVIKSGYTSPLLPKCEEFASRLANKLDFLTVYNERAVNGVTNEHSREKLISIDFVPKNCEVVTLDELLYLPNSILGSKFKLPFYDNSVKAKDPDTYHSTISLIDKVLEQKIFENCTKNEKENLKHSYYDQLLFKFCIVSDCDLRPDNIAFIHNRKTDKYNTEAILDCELIFHEYKFKENMIQHWIAEIYNTDPRFTASFISRIKKINKVKVMDLAIKSGFSIIHSERIAKFITNKKKEVVDAYSFMEQNQKQLQEQ